jgi:hypothetical protein
MMLLKKRILWWASEKHRVKAPVEGTRSIREIIAEDFGCCAPVQHRRLFQQHRVNPEGLRVSKSRQGLLLTADIRKAE